MVSETPPKKKLPHSKLSIPSRMYEFIHYNLQPPKSTVVFFSTKKGVADLNGFALIEGPKVKKDQNEHK